MIDKQESVVTLLLVHLLIGRLGAHLQVYAQTTSSAVRRFSNRVHDYERRLGATRRQFRAANLPFGVQDKCHCFKAAIVEHADAADGSGGVSKS